MFRDAATARRGLVPLALWSWLFWHLHFEWSLNPQYNYGWAVPFLALFLFYLRWRSRPEPDDAKKSGVVVGAFSWLVLVALLPVRILEEANPDWRLLSWSLAFLVVGFSLAEVARAGGRRWLAHFAFPVCFPLIAVPWPVQFENAVVHSLTRAVAYLAVEVAGWIGIGAYQIGNVIQLANGFVGVDEACSGIKTLQAAIMVSLFLGELMRLSVSRRFALVAWGCAWVLACNVLRATSLVIIAARSGIPALEHWHDLIGSVVLILGMAGIAGAAFLLQSAVPSLSTSSPSSAVRVVSPLEPVAALLWLGAIFGATELWYRSHERNLVTRPAWAAQWPDGARAAPIADATQTILRYNTASSAAWAAPQGQWWGFFARWEPGRAAVQLVRSHSPEICLPAIGRTFVRELPPVEIKEAEVDLRFRAYEFVQEGQPLFVFVCTQEDKRAPDQIDPAAVEWSARGRLRAALNGERNLGQRFLELAVVGLADSERASSSVIEAARQIVRPAR